MTEQFEISYLETLVGNPVALGVTIGIIVLMGVILFIRYSPKRRAKVDTPKVEAAVAPVVEEKKEESKGILGTGTFKCIAFRQGNIVDFTTIPKPIGEVYFFDPTCPLSGAGYIVREEVGGKIVDYDPREVRVEIEKTPEYAWHAMNWADDVDGFWIVPLSWWKTPSMWFAVGMMILVFVATLLVLD